MPKFNIDYTKCPNQNMVHGLQLYIEEGIMPGDFLTCLLANDLMGAFAHADHINTHLMKAWCEFLWCYMPAREYGVWGDHETVNEWCELHEQRRLGYQFKELEEGGE